MPELFEVRGVSRKHLYAEWHELWMVLRLWLVYFVVVGTIFGLYWWLK